MKLLYSLHPAAVLPVILFTIILSMLNINPLFSACSLAGSLILIIAVSGVKELLKTLKNVPIVWLSDEHADSFHTIFLDCEATGRLAGNYLYSKGHRKVAVIHESDYTGRGRMKGFRDVFLEQGGTPEQICDILCTVPLHLAVKHVLDFGATALWVTGEDMKALEVNWLIQELAGKRVPEDISLITFYSPEITPFLLPEQTCIRQDFDQLARIAMEKVCALIEEEETDVGILLPNEFIEGNSVSRLN